jgi:predicted nucleic acid-binding protein
MKPIFVDTSALIALGNKNDALHHQTIMVSQQLTIDKRRFITTNAVLLELANTFSQARYKPLATHLLGIINHSAQWECIIVDEELMRRGLELFEQRQDKDWNLVDCISMVVANDFNITEILTSDHHFTQAGFVILLKTAISAG